DEVPRRVRPAGRYRPGLHRALEVVRGRLVDPRPRRVMVLPGNHRPAVSPAISAAMVDGEYPDCSSHRSAPQGGPRPAGKSAAGRMWSPHRAPSPPRPACNAITIGYAVSSSWVPPVSGAVFPLSSELRGMDPSACCWRSNRNRVAARGDQVTVD